jgi:imidazole glycerol-phosphate synthase subunit HisH
MITIVDYGVGNLASVRNMLRRAGSDSVLATTRQQVLQAEKLILPGVGAFDYAARRLRESGLVEPLEERVLAAGVPLLGICLGFQLLTHRSEEGTEAGLGWLDAATVRFDTTKQSSGHRIPHMGWTEVEFSPPSRLFSAMPTEPRFYFVHSYHVTTDSQDQVVATASYGYRFAAAMERGNILGVQFHPEKSHNFGLRLLQNFVRCY